MKDEWALFLGLIIIWFISKYVYEKASGKDASLKVLNENLNSTQNEIFILKGFMPKHTES